MRAEAFAALVDGWTGGVPPRVWSLLVTVFGDLARQDGARLSGAALRAVLAPVGISPQATRTALHRLKRDGWIESARDGRETSYGLTGWGRAQSAQASPRIYATGPGAGRAWLLLAAPGAAPDWPPGAVPLGGGAAIGPCAGGGDAFAVELTAAMPLPGWMRAQLAPAELCAAARDLSARLGALRAGLAGAAAPGPVQGAVLRVLIVHDWRRVALRAPLLPDFVMPHGCAVAECRARVTTLLTALEAPPLSALHAQGPDRASTGAARL